MRLTIKGIDTITGKGVGEWQIAEVVQWDWQYTFELIHPQTREIKTLILKRESKTGGVWNMHDENQKFIMKVTTDQISNHLGMLYRMVKFITES
jgi:hypothetical protein